VPALVEPDRNGQRNSIADDSDVAPVPEAYILSFRAFERSVLIEIRSYAEVRRVSDGHSRHVGADCGAPLDRIETSPFQADLKLARNVLPFKIRF